MGEKWKTTINWMIWGCAMVKTGEEEEGEGRHKLAKRRQMAKLATK